MRTRRWLWIVLSVVLLVGAFTARYVSIGPGGHHRFDIGGEVLDLPLISPTILGWILPGDRARIESAQFSPDGRWLYLSATRGHGDQLASVTLTRPYDGVLLVDLRLITSPIPGGRSAVGILFGTRVWLDQPIYNQLPPITIDVSTDRAVVIGSYFP
jgi:hypothetical protein